MTTGELLVALFEAYRDNDDSAFLRVGMTLIEEEKAKNHYVLANKWFGCQNLNPISILF